MPSGTCALIAPSGLTIAVHPKLIRVPHVPVTSGETAQQPVVPCQ